MFWTESKRIKIVGVCLTFIVLQGCLNGEKKTESKEEIKVELSSEEKLIRQIENELDISAAEHYDVQILPKYIDSDTIKDKLILVNRKEYAYKHVKGTKSENFFNKTGHTGLYNYVFVQLGGKDKLLSTTPVGSNVDFPLEAEFEVLTSAAQKDFYVNYRIKNSLLRNYYTVRNQKIYLTLSCPVFDSVGAVNPVVYDIEYRMSPKRFSKDIVLNNGEFIDYNPNEIQDPNNYTPKGIVSTGELFAYFIFDNERMKYVTPMKPSR